MTDRLAELLPYPRAVLPRPGRFALGPDTPLVSGPGADAAAEAVRQLLGALPWPARAPAIAGGILVDTDPALGAEEYRLLISPDGVRITAGGPAGAFYAAQTIRQLLPDDAWRAAPLPAAAPWSIPCAEIEDGPALPWRGAHLDVARHFFPKPVLLRFIDMLAAHKLNRLHLHLTDDQGWRIESERYPALQTIGAVRPGTQIGKDRQAHDHRPHGGYYPLADLAEINAYAARRMVTVVPELEVPGHARALLAALPELAAAPGARELTVATQWGIFPHIMSPLQATMDVLTDLFGELLGAIPAGFVHIGGDECVLTDWATDPRIIERRDQLGLHTMEALHAHFLRQVADMLAERFGARAVVWDEGFTSSGGAAAGAGGANGAGLRPDTVVMAWHGMEVARKAAEAGYDVIAAPQMPTYFDWGQAEDDREPLSIGGKITAEDVGAFRPVPSDWSAAAAAHLLGAQFQLWTEYIPDARILDYKTHPRAGAFADVAWSGAPAPWTASDAARPALRPRIEADLARLTAAGIEFRPLPGPHPWQQSAP